MAAKTYYPRRCLKEAIDVARTVYQKNAANPMFTITIAEQLGLKGGARAFHQRVTAAANYGLTKGSYVVQKIDLLDRGERIGRGEFDAAYDALSLVPLFERFYERFRRGTGDVPPASPVKDFLRDKYQVPDNKLDAVHKRVVQDAREWYLPQDYAGGEETAPVELPRDKATADPCEIVGAGEVPNDVTRAERHDLVASTMEGHSGVTVNIYIRLTHPDTTEQAVYGNLLVALKKHLLE